MKIDKIFGGGFLLFHIIMIWKGDMWDIPFGTLIMWAAAIIGYFFVGKFLWYALKTNI